MPKRKNTSGAARIQGALANAAEFLVVEAGPDELGQADAARLRVTGEEIGGFARVLTVEGGYGERCLCLGWPTIVVRGPDGRELARWTVHHQTHLRGVGDGGRDLTLRDGPALTAWLAARGLTGFRDAQLALAREDEESEARRARWVAAAPAGLQDFTEAVTRREPAAEDRLASMLTRRIPDRADRIRALTAWAGVPAHENGNYWYELAPQRFLLAESTEAIIDAVTAVPLSPVQLDGAAELFTSLEWTRPPRAEVPQPLRSLLITHVTANGTEPMRFRMRHGYGAADANTPGG